MNFTCEIIEQRSRPWGFEVRALATDSHTGIVYPIRRTWRQGNPGSTVVDAEIARRTAKIEADLVEEAQRDRSLSETIQAEIWDHFLRDLKFIVLGIRNNPGVTYEQFLTYWESNRQATSIYHIGTLGPLLLHAIPGVDNWVDFKGYCINRTFPGID